jgi:hypothetical protein
MASAGPSPKRPPRRKLALPRYAPFYRIVWWLGGLLPSILIALELAGLLKASDVPLITPINTMLVAVIICSAASYSQRRELEAMLIDFAVVMLLLLLQITLIGGLAYWQAASPAGLT